MTPQAIYAEFLPERIFWWLVVLACFGFGLASTVMVIVEFLAGPTATSTRVQMVRAKSTQSIGWMCR